MSLASSNYTRTPKFKSSYNKKSKYNEDEIKNSDILKEINDTQFKSINDNKKRENSKIDLLNSDSLKDIYSVFDNDSMLDLINLDDEDRKSFLGTPNIKNHNTLNDNELFSSPLITHGSFVNNKNNSNDDPESFDYGLDTIDYNMVKENHIITQAYNLANKNCNSEENLIDKHLNDSNTIIDDDNVFDQKENNKNKDNNNDINIFDNNPFKDENQINELTNLYNEFNNTMISSNSNKNLVNSEKKMKKQKSDLDSEFGLILNEIIDQDDSLFDEDNDDLSPEIIKNDNLKNLDKELLKNVKKNNKKLTVTFKDEKDYIKINNNINEEKNNKMLHQINKNENENIYENSLIHENSLPMPPMIFKENNSLKDNLDEEFIDNDTLAQPPIIFENNSDNFSIEELSKMEQENRNTKLNCDKNKIYIENTSKSLKNENAIKLDTSKPKTENSKQLQKLSKEEVARAEKILNDGLFDDDDDNNNDIDIDDDTGTFVEKSQLKSKLTTKFTEIETENEEKLSVLSKEEMVKAEKILDDGLFDDDSDDDDDNDTDINFEKPKLSKEIIDNIKVTLDNDLFDDNDVDIIFDKPELKSRKKELIEFKTDSDKQLSKESFDNPRKLLDDNSSDDNINLDRSESDNELTEYNGFKTGNGKQLPKLSKEALVNAKKMLGDDLFDDDLNMKLEKPELKQKSTEFSGFKTGNGKQLPKLSKEALVNAKKILGDDLFNNNMNLEKSELEKDSTEFSGFKTGNGKQLPELSKEALVNAKKILGDNLFDDNMNMNIEKSELEQDKTGFSGFKTGNGKQLPKLSKEALANAKKILGDDLFNDDLNMNVEKLEIEQESSEFGGFKTGNGKQLPKLSKEALANAKKILGDDLFNNDLNMNVEKPEIEQESSGFSGFKTGNGKQLPKLSKEALANAKKMLGDDLFDDDLNMNLEKSELEKESTGFSGFKTGNGKQLPKLSKEALANAKKMLGDDLFDDGLNMNLEKSELEKESTGFSGFKTGNGKQLPKLSKEALANAKKMLGDDLFDDNMNMNIEKSELKQDLTEFGGFKTGNGKQLPKLSNEALANAKKMLGDDLFDDDLNMNLEKSELEKESTGFSGFKTGNGKQLPKLSKEALTNAKKILGDDLFNNDLNMNVEKPEIEQESSGFNGFKTGNGKQLPKLSKEALANAKKMLGDDLFDDNMNMTLDKSEIKQESTGFNGFKTGNGKQLPKLSKEALANAKKILGDDLFNDDLNMNVEKPEIEQESSGFSGFKTGNGKQLPKLSKEALANAKKMLGDDLFDDNMNINVEKSELEQDSTEFGGFKTGNGKQLPKLSKEALANAKKILGDDLFDDNLNMNVDKSEIKQESTGFGIFKTGNGKTVPAISNDALLKAKQLLGEDVYEDLDHHSTNINDNQVSKLKANSGKDNLNDNYKGNYNSINKIHFKDIIY